MINNLKNSEINSEKIRSNFEKYEINSENSENSEIIMINWFTNSNLILKKI